MAYIYFCSLACLTGCMFYCKLKVGRPRNDVRPGVRLGQPPCIKLPKHSVLTANTVNILQSLCKFINVDLLFLTTTQHGQSIHRLNIPSKGSQWIYVWKVARICMHNHGDYKCKHVSNYLAQMFVQLFWCCCYWWVYTLHACGQSENTVHVVNLQTSKKKV